MAAFIQHKASTSCRPPSPQRTESPQNKAENAGRREATTTFQEETKNAANSLHDRRKSAELDVVAGRKSAELYNGVALGSPSVSGSGQVDQDQEDRRSEDDRRSDIEMDSKEAKRHLFSDAETNTVSSSGRLFRWWIFHKRKLRTTCC